jgi:hypothetical protein
MKGINRVSVGLSRRQVLPGYFPTLHFRRDHHQILHHRIGQGRHLRLLHRRCLHYGKEGNPHDGMDNSLGSVEVMAIYSFRNGNKGKRI